MKNFWKVRIATLTWGFGVSYFFTGDIGLASKMFVVMAAGNTLLMWLLIK